MIIMNEKLFENTETGKLHWIPEGMYYQFEPKKLPFNYNPSFNVMRQLTKTLLALGELNGLSQKFSRQEIRLMQYPFMVKEATLSSEIEGTRSTITDVYKGKKIEETNIEKRLDNEEVNNYLRALEFALKKEDGKITEALLKEIHKMLLEGVRGSGKNPGEYKEVQNAVGNREDTLDSAKFVPASPKSTPELMNNLINFINSNDYDPLCKIAVSHYQLETIHPFRDGNGRLGRMLIMLQICREGILNYPLLYISEFFNRNRDTYTEGLFNVSSRGDLENWILFFLRALESQSKISLKLLNKIQEYKIELQEKMHELSQSPNMHLLIESLFKQPFISVRDIMKPLKISQPAAWNLLQKLSELDIIREVDVKKRSKIYVAHKIIDIIEGKI